MALSEVVWSGGARCLHFHDGGRRFYFYHGGRYKRHGRSKSLAFFGGEHFFLQRSIFPYGGHRSLTGVMVLFTEDITLFSEDIISVRDFETVFAFF